MKSKFWPQPTDKVMNQRPTSLFNRRFLSLGQRDMSSGALTMQEACQDIANLHTYSESVTPPWLSTQHTACEGRRARQCLRFEVFSVSEKLNCSRLGYGTLYSGRWFIKTYLFYTEIETET